MAQRLGLVKKWLFLPIFPNFGQTGGYTSPFGQCDTAFSCPDQVYYLLGRNWDSTWPDWSTFSMAQCLGLVKKWLFLPIFTIFGQTGGYTSPFGHCDTAFSCPDQVYYLWERNWEEIGTQPGPDRSTFPMAQRLGLVKK